MQCAVIDLIFVSNLFDQKFPLTEEEEHEYAVFLILQTPKLCEKNLNLKDALVESIMQGDLLVLVVDLIFII